jgi:hypothetical protein
VSILHEVEKVLYEELLPSMREPGETISVTTLAGIVVSDSKRLILVPRSAMSFPRAYEDCYPKKPRDLEKLSDAEILRSFFAREDAWRCVSDRSLYGATITAARREYGHGTREANFAVRLACAVSLGILARRGVRLTTRDGLPPIRPDEAGEYADFNRSSVPRVDSFARADADSFATADPTHVNNLERFGVVL